MTRLLGGHQRRRLAAALAAEQGADAAQPTPPTAAAPATDQLPAAQQHLAGLVPTSGFALAGVSLLVLLTVGIAIAPAIAREAFGYELLPNHDAYGTSLGHLRRCLGLHEQATLAGWLTQVYLLLAAATALVVRSLHRHRRDQFKNRSRVWGCLATVWIAAALATAVPVGPAVAAALLTLTATPFGPHGLGWWATCGATGLLLTVPLAILRMRERLPTAAPLGMGLVLWAGATACIWQSANDPRLLQAANASWLVGSSLILMAMLVAVRSSLREITGCCRQPTATRTKKKQKTPRLRPAAASPAAESVAAEPVAEAAPADTFIDFQEVSDEPEPDVDVEPDAEPADGQSPQRLSKAERRRLRKLARRGQAA